MGKEEAKGEMAAKVGVEAMEEPLVAAVPAVAAKAQGSLEMVAAAARARAAAAARGPAT